MANMISGTGSVSAKVGSTIDSVISIQQEIQSLDPNKKEDQKRLQELTSQAQVMDIFLKKLKELEGILVEMMKTASRKGQA